MPNILTRAQRLVELSHKATAGEWIVHKDDVGDEEIIMVSTGIKDVAGYEVVSSDGGLFPWDGQRKYAESDANASFIAASRNDGPAIAQALVEVIDILTRLDQHMDFGIPYHDNRVCDECGNGYEDASGVNKAMEDARDFLARMEMTLDA